MKCPKCQTEPLDRAPALPNVGSPRICPVCRGLWVEKRLYRHPAAEAFREQTATARSPAGGYDLKTGLCPLGHGLLTRVRIGREPRFYLDRCARCGGIWFDGGEWDRIVRARLLDHLPRLWTRTWRRHRRAAEASADHLAWARRRFGPELLAELQELAGRLEGSAVRSEALAFLRETSARTGR